MIKKIGIFRLTAAAFIAAGLCTLVSCAEEFDWSPPRFGSDSTIVTGRIAAVFDSLPVHRIAESAVRTDSNWQQPEPRSAWVGIPGDDGGWALLALGTAGHDSFVVADAPPGRRDLFVMIIDPDDSVVGRVLVQDSARPDTTLVTEPINAETSLETAVYLGAHVDRVRDPEGRANPPQVALVHRISEEVASQAATDLSEIRALVDAYRRAQEGLVEGYIAMSGTYDSLGVNAGVRDYSQAYAEARDAGTPAPEAHDAFVDGAVAAHIERAGTPAEVTTAWGAFATLHDVELAGRTTLPRLESAQNLLHVSVAARQALVATVPDGTAGKEEVNAALDDILAAGMAATEMASFVDAVAAQVEEGAAALQTARGADLSDELRAADLSGHIDPSMSPEEIAAGLPEYLGGVEIGAGGSDLAALLVALMGGPGYEPGE